MLEKIVRSDSGAKRFLWIFGICGGLSFLTGVGASWMYHYSGYRIFAVIAFLDAICWFFCTMYFFAIALRMVQDRANRNGG